MINSTKLLHSWYFSPLAVFLLFIMALGGCKAAGTPGCETPAATMTRIATALQEQNRDDLAMCLGAYVRFSPATARSMADTMLLSKDMQAVIIDGVKKYGADDFARAMGMSGFLLYSIGSQQPFALMVKKGTLKLEGEKATYSYKDSAKGDELRPTQPELAAFDKAENGGSVNGEMSMPLEKIAGRWYLASPGLKHAEDPQKAYTALTAFLKDVRQCIKDSKDITAFKAALKAPMQKLMSMH